MNFFVIVQARMTPNILDFPLSMRHPKQLKESTEGRCRLEIEGALDRRSHRHTTWSLRYENAIRETVVTFDHNCHKHNHIGLCSAAIWTSFRVVSSPWTNHGMIIIHPSSDSIYPRRKCSSIRIIQRRTCTQSL